MAIVLTQRQGNQVLRTQVHELLARSSSFRALSAAQRRITLTRMVAATKFLANANGLTAQFGLRLTETRDGKAQAASVVSRVDFPGFVAGLLHGVFDAIVTSSIEQMQAYSALVSAVANDVDLFMRDSAARSDVYLAHRWPQWFSKQSGQALTFDAQQKSVALNEVLATMTPELRGTRPTLAAARKATRRVLAFDRQQSALNEINQAVQRILPSDRSLSLERLPVTFPQIFVGQAPVTLAPIQGVSSGTAGFVGLTARNISGEAVLPVTSWSEFERNFGGLFIPTAVRAGQHFLPYAVRGFFANGGTRAYIAPINVNDDEAIADAHYIGDATPASGLAALAAVDDIHMLLAPGVTLRAVQAAMVAQCESRRDRICLLDMPLDFPQPWAAPPIDSGYAATHWPWLLPNDTSCGAAAIPPSGHVAGQYARLPAHRAPRNEAIADATGLSRSISVGEQGKLTDVRINALRQFSASSGAVVWGQRSLSADPDWRYLSTRRYATYVEQSIANGLQWVVFEPNTIALWQRVRAQVENFLLDEWHNGALLGAKPEHAWFAKCDQTTMTQADIDNARLIVLIGIATLRPAEFVSIRIEHKTACGN